MTRDRELLACQMCAVHNRAACTTPLPDPDSWLCKAWLARARLQLDLDQARQEGRNEVLGKMKPQFEAIHAIDRLPIELRLVDDVSDYGSYQEVAEAQLALDQSKLPALLAQARQEGRNEVLGKMERFKNDPDIEPPSVRYILSLSEADYESLKEK